MRRPTFSHRSILIIATAAFFSMPEPAKAGPLGVFPPAGLPQLGFHYPYPFQASQRYYSFYGVYPYYGGYRRYGFGGHPHWHFGPELDRPRVVRPDPTAHVTVHVPPDAEVWFNGAKMELTGAIREFFSPPLTAGRRYSYQVRLRWKDKGQMVTQTRKVVVSAGARVHVDFLGQEPDTK